MVLRGNCMLYVAAVSTDSAPPAGDSDLAHWALARLTPPPMWPRTLLDLSFAHPYLPPLGFAVAVDAAARLGRALPAIALTSVFPPGSFYQDHPVSDDVKVPHTPTSACSWILTGHMNFPDGNDCTHMFCV